jgi:broad specificity phosphatase PhoE
LRGRKFGIYEGKLNQEIEEMKLTANNINVEGERRDKFLLRIKKSFDILTNLFNKHKIIVVSHGGY